MKALPILLVLLMLWSAIWRPGPGDYVARELELELPTAQTTDTYDDHGGFHGDGTTCTIIQLSDDALLEEIEKAGTWQAFPPDDAVNQLLYGSYLADAETQEPFVPPIENGYYLLKDRNAKAAEQPNIMTRGSFNFDLAVYDADNRTLYYLVLDT